MKLIASNATFMGFYFFEIVYTQFYLNETPFISFFLNSLSCHKKSYVIAYLMKMKLTLGVALETGL
jgi:hypothetical protein